MRPQLKHDVTKKRALPPEKEASNKLSGSSSSGDGESQPQKNDFPTRHAFPPDLASELNIILKDISLQIHQKLEEQFGSNIFPSLENNLLPRQPESFGKHIPGNGHTPRNVHLKHEMIYGPHPSMNATHPAHVDSLEIMEPLCSPSLPPVPPESTNGHMRATFYPHSMNTMTPQQTIHNTHNIHANHHVYRGGLPSHTFERMQNDELDPRDLEAFAERFKQRRIKLGVTQADVGRALKQHASSETCAPFVVEAAECQARGKKRDTPFVLPPGDKKRKRTSIAALEKRSLRPTLQYSRGQVGTK
ncbi:POU domain protein [Caerostris extrusa]|uniref:POU domain protein n=1 Tax=Caerostris extrusa TaxID=172846 RepID=A0AAV4NEE8_CAEEX|nr:POU domain protein [Caerostris extrusa]